MNYTLIETILIPFIGTMAGSGCVFLLRGKLRENVQRSLLGFAAGVMTAASVWSLIIPSVESCAYMGKLAFIPASVGIAAGMAFLLALDSIVPHLHINARKPEGRMTKHRISRSTMLMLAVTLHNIPEGMAPGVALGAAMREDSKITYAKVIALAVGMAIQNFPEGAVISLPLAGEGVSKKKAFVKGTLSGAVEPLAALAAFALTSFITPILPYLLSFAAGAMLYVVVEELVPETQARLESADGEEHSNHGTVGFGIGFIVMMILDTALG